MAPVCNRFIQNAWKKDMCSNCFRAKIEHVETRVVSSCNKKIIGPVKGIIKSPNGKRKDKKRTVSFSPNPVQVIGHGGEEWSDDEGVDECNSPGLSEDDTTVNEEDKELERITKINTDNNTNLVIQNSTEKRRTFTQLMLGKPQTDSDGNKQTLMVSVTPFGSDDSKELTKKNLGKSHIPIAKNKDGLVDKKPNVVLTSYTKSKDSVDGKGGDTDDGDGKSGVINGGDVKNNGSGDLKIGSGDMKISSGDMKIGSGDMKIGSGDLQIGSGDIKSRDVTNGDVKCKDIGDVKNKKVNSADVNNGMTNGGDVKSGDNCEKTEKNSDIKGGSIKSEEVKNMESKGMTNGELNDTEKTWEIKNTTVNNMKTKNGLINRDILGNIGVNREEVTKVTNYKEINPKEINYKEVNSKEINYKEINSKVINYKELSPKEINLTEINSKEINNQGPNAKEVISQDQESLNSKEINYMHPKEFNYRGNSKENNLQAFNPRIMHYKQVHPKEINYKEINSNPKEVIYKEPNPIPRQYNPSKINSKELTTFGSKELTTFNSKELTTFNSKELTTFNSKELTTFNSKEYNSKEYNSKEVNSKELNAPDSKENSLMNSQVVNSNLKDNESKEIVESCEIEDVDNSEVMSQEANNQIQELTPDKQQIKPASTINSELVKSRTELTIQLTPVLDDLESDESFESITILPKESREQAGEPDGRADPDVVNEPPALPLTPPPPLLNPRISFLHGSPKDKPKVPSKPEKVLQLFKKVTSDLPPIDPNKTPNKRRAPNPPPSPVIEPSMTRSASLPEAIPPPPEPAPRRTLSASQENLLAEIELLDKNKKPDKSTKSKFSLKKFLRVGGNNKTLPEKQETKAPQIKPRLVIVHPLELNGSIEVVKQEEPSQQPPAPPPRNLSQPTPTEPKPTPPPPKSEELLRKQSQQPPQPLQTRTSSDNVYANLGEVRSGLAPNKPQRTASMREREALIEQRRRMQQNKEPVYTNNNNKEYIKDNKDYTYSNNKEYGYSNNNNNNNGSNKEDHVYERVTPRRVTQEELSCERQQNRLNKSTSLQSYNGSEMSIDNELIYSPCSYYGSETDIVDGNEWSGCSRPCKLRCRKGRSIVHKNLEDNYGAVVVANREALAQVLENLHQTPSLQPALRGLQTATVLRWTDFAVVDGTAGVSIGKRSFYHGLWGPHHVTLALSKEQASIQKPLLGSFSLTPVIEFSDLIPSAFLPTETRDDNETNLIQASVSVLPWMHIDTIHNFGSVMKARFAQGQNDEVQREISFILLQLINGLKTLQAQGTEEVPLSLNNLVLCRDADRDVHHRLCLLQGLEDLPLSANEKLGSLCQCAMAALDELLPQHRLGPLIKCLLRKESSMSLSQVKSVLEFSLWGPSDVALGVPLRDRELALQRWLDLERATVLHGLVGTRVQLSVLEECHLLFLVRSSAKMMSEAALLLESNGVS